MNGRTWSCLVCVLIAGAICGSYVACSDPDLPGETVSGDALLEVRAGELRGPCADTGNACTWTPNNSILCATDEEGQCANGAVDCGECEGPNHKQCESTDETWCGHVWFTCCTTDKECQLAVGGCTCQFKPGKNESVGSRQDC